MFIALEGGEGAGKSTQARMLGKALTHLGIEHIVTREPGDTALGAELRQLLLRRDGIAISRRAEALLFMADRAEHVEKVLWPALKEGKLVICDRYSASTMAYQGYAGALGVGELQMISSWASEGLKPDVTYFLDVNPAVGLERSKREEHTRFEDKALQYHVDVRQGFMKVRDKRWRIINADLPATDVHNIILNDALTWWWARD